MKPELLTLLQLARLMDVRVSRRKIKEAIKVIRARPALREESRSRKSSAMLRSMARKEASREASPHGEGRVKGEGE